MKIKKSNGVIYNAVILSCWAVCKLLYRFEVIGSENIPDDGRCIICPNHTSNADPVLLGVSKGRKVFFMAKSELFKSKIMSSIFRFFGAFPVQRDKSDKSAINHSVKILEEGKPLVIFLEGTRSRTGELLKPKSGAAMLALQTNTPIIPVFIGPRGGGRVKVFKKIKVKIGKPLDSRALGFQDGSLKEVRNASRIVMDKIREMREE